MGVLSVLPGGKTPHQAPGIGCPPRSAVTFNSVLVGSSTTCAAFSDDLNGSICSTITLAVLPFDGQTRTQLSVPSLLIVAKRASPSLRSVFVIVMPSAGSP